ncbi:hypothetical protein [Thermoflexus hugenholtzii]|jgi:hypothetical protein|uniref:Uncharacterized protein n=1 Tax=Thermoflexus hugenholtzii JAD2 TaxID=877466 RepID=A0A212RDN9_9CHLR|nr:hypothetical protein [Thermoflexus hugenholtzii]SNB70410.1 hypothetical protein SAMN02746019_00012240 [Thermoflexus hugenholtzii JAD2]
MGPLEVINRYSFLVLGGAALLGLAVVLGLRRAGGIGWGIWLLLLLALVVFGLSRRAQPSAPFSSEEEIAAAWRSGRPVLVYWFSNY